MDKGDFARSLNIAATIVAQDNKLIAEGSPDQIAEAIAFVAEAVYKKTAELADELGISDDTGRDARPKPVRDQTRTSSPSASRYSKPSSTPKSSPTGSGGGGLSESPKQTRFFQSLIAEIEKIGGEPVWSYDDLRAAGTYDERQEMVNELIAQRDELK